jgi:hypothetical protein
MQELAAEESRRQLAEQDLREDEAAIAAMEQELLQLDSNPCPVCSVPVLTGETEGHVRQCVVELKQWVTSVVGEHHIEECENQALIASQEAARIRQTLGENHRGSAAFESVRLRQTPVLTGLTSRVTASQVLAGAPVGTVRPVGTAGKSNRPDSLAEFLERAGLASLYEHIREHGFTQPMQLAGAALRLKDLRLSSKEHRKLALALQPLLQLLPGHSKSPQQSAQSGSPAEQEGDLLSDSRAALRRATAALADAAENTDAAVVRGYSAKNELRCRSSRKGLALELEIQQGRRKAPASSYSVTWLHGGREMAAVLEIGKSEVELRRADVFSYNADRAAIARWRYDQIRKWQGDGVGVFHLQITTGKTPMKDKVMKFLTEYGVEISEAIGLRVNRILRTGDTTAHCSRSRRRGSNLQHLAVAPTAEARRPPPTPAKLALVEKLALVDKLPQGHGPLEGTHLRLDMNARFKRTSRVGHRSRVPPPPQRPPPPQQHPPSAPQSREGARYIIRPHAIAA